MNYLVSQARTVEGSVNRALGALLERNDRLASEVFLTEPRINEMEIVIDEHAIRMLRQGNLLDTDVRLIVATLKINNDLERMGDLAVNLGERAISLAAMGDVHTPAELEPMTTAVRAMVSKCLGALIYQNVDLATQVLESDDVVDQLSRSSLRSAARRHDARIPRWPLRISNSFSLRAISNASPTTPRTSPRTFSSGCADWKCATAARSSSKLSRRTQPPRLAGCNHGVFTCRSSRIQPASLGCVNTCGRGPASPDGWRVLIGQF